MSNSFSKENLFLLDIPMTVGPSDYEYLLSFFPSECHFLGKSYNIVNEACPLANNKGQGIFHSVHADWMFMQHIDYPHKKIIYLTNPIDRILRIYNHLMSKSLESNVFAKSVGLMSFRNWLKLCSDGLTSNGLDNIDNVYMRCLVPEKTLSAKGQPRVSLEGNERHLDIALERISEFDLIFADCDGYDDIKSSNTQKISDLLMIKSININANVSSIRYISSDIAPNNPIVNGKNDNSKNLKYTNTDFKIEQEDLEYIERLTHFDRKIYEFAISKT